MINIEHDIGQIFLHCRFSKPDQLVDLLRHRVRRFVEYIEDKADESGSGVLWTDQPGGVVTEAKFPLDQNECERLADQIEQNKEFRFLAWTPWSDDDYPSVAFERKQLLGDKTHINFRFPAYHLCQSDDLKGMIDCLIGFIENNDIGFYTEISLRTENPDPDMISPFEWFNLYYSSNNGAFTNLGIKDRPNSDLPEGVFADPVALAEEWIPKYRKLS